MIIDNEFSEDAKVMLYVCGAMHELERRGMLTLHRFGVTPLGLSVWDQLRASGYRPKLWDIEAAVRSISSTGYFFTPGSKSASEKDIGSLVVLIDRLDKIVEEDPVEEAEG